MTPNMEQLKKQHNIKDYYMTNDRTLPDFPDTNTAPTHLPDSIVCMTFLPFLLACFSHVGIVNFTDCSSLVTELCAWFLTLLLSTDLDFSALAFSIKMHCCTAYESG